MRASSTARPAAWREVRRATATSCSTWTSDRDALLGLSPATATSAPHRREATSAAIRSRACRYASLLQVAPQRAWVDRRQDEQVALVTGARQTLDESVGGEGLDVVSRVEGSLRLAAWPADEPADQPPPLGGPGGPVVLGVALEHPQAGQEFPVCRSHRAWDVVPYRGCRRSGCHTALSNICSNDVKWCGQANREGARPPDSTIRRDRSAAGWFRRDGPHTLRRTATTFPRI